MIFSISFSSFATVPVKNAYTNVPVSVCTPSDSNANCAGSSGGGNVGVGTVNYVPEYVSVSTLGPSNIVDVSGNVGVGSTAPGTQLDVNGTVRMNGFNMANGALNNYVLTTDGNGNGTWQAAAGGTSQWSGAAGSNIYYSGPNVGVGTSLSTNNLDVANNVAIGTTYAGYHSAPSNGLAVQGNTGIGTWVPAGALDVEGTLSNAFFHGSLGIGTTTMPSNKIFIAHVATELDQFYVDNNGGVHWYNGGGLTYNEPDSSGNYNFGNFNVQNTQSTANFTAGNVGIGSAQPGRLLDVGGILRVKANSNTAIYLTNSGSEVGQIGMNTNNALTLQGSAGILDNSGLVVGYGTGAGNVPPANGLAVSGNLGIGTTLPAAELDVEGTSNVFFGGVASGSINVGIGSTAPGVALDVNGTVRGGGSGCSYLYRCVGGVDAGVIQTSACNLCPAGTCTQMSGCF